MRTWALALSLAALDATWVTAWLAWAAAGGLLARAPGWLMCVAVAWLALALARTTAVGFLSRPAGAAVGGLVGLAVIGAVARILGLGLPTLSAGATSAGSGVVVLVVALAFLWWRGARLGLATSSAAAVRRGVLGAAVALSVLALFGRLGTGLNLGPYIVTAFVAALSALALAELEGATVAGGSTADLGARWVVWVGLAMAAAAGVALLLASVLTLGLAQAGLRQAQPVLAVLQPMLADLATIVTMPVAILEWLIRGLMALAMRLFGTEEPTIPRGAPGAAPPLPVLVGESAPGGLWIVRGRGAAGAGRGGAIRLAGAGVPAPRCATGRCIRRRAGVGAKRRSFGAGCPGPAAVGGGCH